MGEGWLRGYLRAVTRVQGRDSEHLGAWDGGAEEGGSRVWYLSSTRELSSKVQSRLSLLGKRKCF